MNRRNIGLGQLYMLVSKRENVSEWQQLTRKVVIRLDDDVAFNIKLALVRQHLSN